MSQSGIWTRWRRKHHGFKTGYMSAGCQLWNRVRKTSKMNTVFCFQSFIDRWPSLVCDWMSLAIGFWVWAIVTIHHPSRELKIVKTHQSSEKSYFLYQSPTMSIWCKFSIITHFKVHRWCSYSKCHGSQLIGLLVVSYYEIGSEKQAKWVPFFPVFYRQMTKSD